MSVKKTLAVLIAAVAAGGLLGYTLIQTGLIPTTTISTIRDLIADPSTFSWGNFKLNEQVTRTVNLTNIGEAPINLTATISNASETLTDYSLMWDVESLILQPANSVLANFSLTVYNATDGAFSFDIIIGDQS